MPSAIVLGAGMVGSVIAADLARDDDFDVAIADVRSDALQAAQQRAAGRIRTVQADCADPEAVKRLVEPFDIVLGALASRIGFQTLRAIIEAGKHYCDISFMPENALDLDELARANDVTAVVDCGVAPGMSNLLAARGAAELDETHAIEIYVGGLPRERHWPFEYKAGFAPADVIEEYTRPARFVEHGRIVTREALSEPELIDFAGAGTLEAFNTDGLRSLIHTLDVPFMKEKTLRYPEHIELMRVFRATGLFSHEPIEIEGAAVRPIDVMSRLLFPKWMYQEGEEDLTVMRIIVSGLKDGRERHRRWDLLDYYDRQMNATSMARTTAFPCAIIARLIARGRFARRGVSPPEFIGRDEAIVNEILREHERRGVRYEQSDER
ncbi:MAG: saccharopine dehydrogenase C-terminal domain-containing protein [Planctomycetota bacterium]|nr:saccharopine dehydrogenase C-terminal domain-containing protein [Planctomycetota bacterium]